MFQHLFTYIRDLSTTLDNPESSLILTALDVPTSSNGIYIGNKANQF